MKKAIIVLIIGAALYLGGYALRENAKNRIYREGYKRSLVSQQNEGKHIQTGGVVVLIAGGLWLIVLAIQEKKK